jgi:hypothetical protein
MKKIATAGLLWAALTSLAFGADATKNFTIIIDGKIFEINPGDTLHDKSKSGAPINITLKRKEFATFVNGALQFEYRGGLSVASTDIDHDIHQHLVASALGTLLIVQQYDKINPGMLTEFMLKQMTDGDVAAAAKLESQPFTVTLADGTIMKGVKASIKSDKDDVSLQVLAADTGIGGVMAISRINNDMAKEEQSIVDRFWSTLKVKK